MPRTLAIRAGPGERAQRAKPGNLVVVTIADGSAPNPEAFLKLFHDLVKRAALRPIRLHDLRQDSNMPITRLASGVPVKVVSQRIGHGDITVTLKVYAHVLPGDDEKAAMLADRLIDASWPPG